MVDPAGVGVVLLECRQRDSFFDDQAVKGVRVIAVLRRQQLARRLADRGGLVQSVELRLVAIDQLVAGVTVLGADHRRNGVDDRLQQVSAFPQGLLDLFMFRDVRRHHDRAAVGHSLFLDQHPNTVLALNLERGTGISMACQAVPEPGFFAPDRFRKQSLSDDSADEFLVRNAGFGKFDHGMV